jgi:hypothetical protein
MEQLYLSERTGYYTRRLVGWRVELVVVQRPADDLRNRIVPMMRGGLLLIVGIGKNNGREEYIGKN